MADFELVRSGAYVCQCPNGGAVLNSEKRLVSKYREAVSEQLILNQLVNASLSLDQLALDSLDERLGDKRLIGEQLARQQLQWASSNASGPEERAKHDSRQAGQFALGAQLEADIALEWFAQSNASTFEATKWPAQVCRLCRPHQSRQPTGNQSVDLSVATTSASLALDPSIQQASPTEEGADDEIFYCEDFRSSGENPLARLVRPTVMTLQATCALLTLVLLAILLRIRKSRVSTVHCHHWITPSSPPPARF